MNALKIPLGRSWPAGDGKAGVSGRSAGYDNVNVSGRCAGYDMSVCLFSFSGQGAVFSGR